jgi:hypothetical protein
MSNENSESPQRPNPQRPPAPLEERGIVNDVILPAIAAGVGTAIGNQVPKLGKKDK